MLRVLTLLIAILCCICRRRGPPGRDGIRSPPGDPLRNGRNGHNGAAGAPGKAEI